LRSYFAAAKFTAEIAAEYSVGARLCTQTDACGVTMDTTVFAAPKYAPIEPDWRVISGMSRRTTYEELGRGNLKAIKVGARTLIDVEAGLAWLRSLPPAKIRAPRERQRVAA
jgi:hypothetical protein